MTELDLYKFCQDCELDWRGDELMLWIPFWKLEGFVEMVGYGYLADESIDAHLTYDNIAVELNDICEYFDIDCRKILKKINT